MLRRLPLLRRRLPPPPSASLRRLLSIPSRPPPPPLNSLSPPPPPPPTKSRLPYLVLSLAVISSLAFASSTSSSSSPDNLYTQIDDSIKRCRESLERLSSRMRHTGAAAAVLWKSLMSVLTSANNEVRLGFELRVASLLADILAASGARRAAIMAAGDGAVVDWLLEVIGGERSGGGGGAQAEAARALAYLIGDPDMCAGVLGRPHAVPSLLRFIFSYQPRRRNKKHLKHSSYDGDIMRGRSMLVTAIMEVITLNCESFEKASLQPLLPAQADMRDIAAAIEVIMEGALNFDEHHEDKDDDGDGDEGIKGIGIKILDGTTVLGLARKEGLLEVGHSDYDYTETTGSVHDRHLRHEHRIGSTKLGKFVSSAPGLWDDLQREHVAVPFAAWALANWALASEANRVHIQELDGDGHAVLRALAAPERTVKWHGSLVARVLLEDQNLSLSDSVPDWSFSLLSTVSQATKSDDISLARVAVSAFLLSLERSTDAQMVVMEKGLPLMRGIAKQIEKHRQLQETLARALEILSMGEKHLSLEESQRWSAILLPWVCGKDSSDATRHSVMRILSCIFEDYGQASLPISQAWLTILLNEILHASKSAGLKGTNQVKNNKVKTQIDQSNFVSAAQVANQLASTVVCLVGHQLQPQIDSADRSPFTDLLSLEPFSVPYKNMNKGSATKFNLADPALATLKGVKALAEVCTEDLACQNKLVDFGVLCLLRRLLMSDDYEQLVANGTYDASKNLESEQVSDTTGENPAINGQPVIQVPLTVHIRKHAARLLTLLSSLPKVQKVIVTDEVWCRWLEDCANGRVSGCDDLKIQSYARATLLNAFCSEKVDQDAMKDDVGGENQMNLFPVYDDQIFLINPELPHWKCVGKNYPQRNIFGANKSSYPDDSSSQSHDESIGSGGPVSMGDSDYGSSCSISGSDVCSESADARLDIVFVHGLRGGPFKSWRIADNKSSTTRSGLVEKIDQEAGKQGTCWPKEWLSADLPHVRMFSVKYKTNLTQWSGASLPLQEVSSVLLKKLVAAGIGDRPVVFITHSMGGLIVKEMLYEARENNIDNFVNNTIGVVFYSCPHFGSRLADMPWRMGYVLRPAPSIWELRSGSPRLVELNDFLRHLHNKRLLEVLSFSETKVTPIVEGYGGWAIRMEIVPIESAYPGFGELVVLDGTDHINSCKPVNRCDPSYAETLEFLRKLNARVT
ncbi:hypothetical protein QJS04_geneDACA017175 [Acorus gramineus]|uniref:Protein SERAC1 n=1 Tax=Acorus gramineus TaxID=55184 RepID=A0AAV9BK76_ACOGR|nr:hypothetical protein QJS04_geneDACA017175 [Acorus gramineus]